MADAPSVTTFVMDKRLPWPDDGAVRELDGPFDAGVIHGSGKPRDCWIRRISALGATLGGDVAVAAGDEIAVELANGQRPAATIDWVGRGEAGVVFKQPIDVIALINRNLIAQPAERRTMPRVELRCRVHLKWGATVAAAVLRNISAKGLQVEGEGLPPGGTFVSTYVDGLNVPAGEVVWQTGNLTGIELLDELTWSSIIHWIREIGRRVPA